MLLMGLAVLAIPLLGRPRLANHYLWRISLSVSLAIYSYLFVYVTGGAVTMYFHVLLVMAFMAVYADWRLEWLLCGYYAGLSLLLDAFAPHLFYVYGHTALSVPIQLVFVLIMAYFTTVLCQNHRLSIEDLVIAKRRNDQFLAIAAHELRTPLTSMKGYTEVLERRLKRSSQADLLRYASKLDDQLSRMTNLIRDLLDISKIQAGQVSLRRERLSINSVVAQSVEEMQAVAHHHQIVASGWSNMPVMGDPVRLSQVMVNLLSNAVKYSPDSDRVVVRVAEARDKVIVSVQDFGIGIPAKEHDRIFEPYFRSQNALREDVPGGLGMGLYIAAEIIQRHGGRIWLDSREGEGSTFSFLLPLTRGPNQGPAPKEALHV
jgi:signal transduction histidine kinase